jgi:hypothetical protein
VGEVENSLTLYKGLVAGIKIRLDFPVPDFDLNIAGTSN